MGLIDRFASRVTGPEPPDPVEPPPTRPTPVVGAGARVNLHNPSLVHTKHPEWQTAAWDYRDSVPELRFAGEFIANSLGRLRMFVAEDRPRGEEPIPLADPATVPAQVAATQRVDDGTRAAAIAAFDRLNLGSRGNSLLGRLGENLEFAAECYLLGEIDEDGDEEWTIRSVSEIQVTQGGARLIEPQSGSASRDLNPDATDLLRLWTAHPRYMEWPDSPIAALLGTLEAMTLLEKRGRAHDRSRISSGKGLYVPDELSLARPGQAPVSAEIDGAAGDDDESDPFMEALTTLMTAPIGDESDPSAVVPLIIRGPAMAGDKPMADVLRTFDLHGEDPQKLDERYESAVLRLARGLNLPPERMKGLGNTTHWNANTITVDEVKTHIEPRAERMCDALTAAYLRPALKAMGVPPEQRRRVCLWFDASELVQNPNPEERAGKAHDAGIISDAAYRRELGFTDNDKPDNLEMLRRAVDRERLAPASVPVLLKILGGQMPTQADIAAIQQAYNPSGSISQRISPAGREVIDATPTGLGPSGPAGQQAPAAKPAGITAAANRRGPRDDPSGPSVAGVALMAADTGRVLMLQRGLDDDTDPAAGTWEFPGGHIEDGDDTSLHGGMREWAEEVGQPFPPGGAVLHTWTSPDGVYQGHVVVIDSEDQLDLAAERTVTNADDDYSEQAAWWDPDHAAKNPALRREVRKTPWSALKRAVRTWRSPLAAAAAEPGRFRVDEHAAARLAQIDHDLQVRLLALAEGTVGRAVERAANRVRARAQKDPTLAACFPKGCEPAAVCAAAGRAVQGELSDADAVEGALDTYERQWDIETRRAAEAAAPIVAGLVGDHATRGLVDAFIAGARTGWRWLRPRLSALIPRILYGEYTPYRTRHGEQSPGIVPVSLLRGALAQAGGLDERSPGVTDDGVPVRGAGPVRPLTGLVTGQTTRQAIADGGGHELGMVWSYHGIARDSFPPHLALEGTRFVDFDDPRLATRPDDAGWIGSHYHPGDHTGCMCSVNMLWATPQSPDGRSSEGLQDAGQLEETPRQRAERLLAEDDDRNPGRGTLPDGRTHAQRARDERAELARLREQHIRARDAGGPLLAT